MSNKTNRMGEEKYNDFGSKMIITKYKTNKNIDVYFPEYNWTARNVEYKDFKNGNIACPYERRYYGVGYIGEGKYKTHDKNGRPTKAYLAWCEMLKRCYGDKNN